jgi:hypothetical protein
VKKPLPELKTDEDAATFVATADLIEYDLSEMKLVRFQLAGSSGRGGDPIADHQVDRKAIPR